MTESDNNILQLPDSSRVSKSRRELARWLREIADAIDADIVETDPHAALLVLTGRDRHEVVCAGYREDDHGLTGAASAAYFVLGAGFVTAGRNIRDRNHALYGSPFRRHNVVDFGPPRRRQDDGSGGKS